MGIAHSASFNERGRCNCLPKRVEGSQISFHPECWNFVDDRA